MSGLNVELREAEPSWVASLGCVVDRRRIERQTILSLVQRGYLRGVESGWPKIPDGPVAWGKP